MTNNTIQLNEVSIGSMFQQVTQDELYKLNQSKDTAYLNEVLGGIRTLAQALRTDLREGRPADETSELEQARKLEFGDNTYPEPPRKTVLRYCLEALKDTTLIILMVATVISLVFNTIKAATSDDPHDKLAFMDAVGIFIAVILVTSVTSFNNWNKERQFRSLNKVKEDSTVKVIRGGEKFETSIYNLVVGDVLFLDCGDKVPADGLFIEGNSLKTDESVMTGETDMVKKSAERPFMLSGCQVGEGNGFMLVTAVGINTEWGQTISKLVVEPEPTPLQNKLDKLASNIGKFGLAVAVVLFVVLVIELFVRNKPGSGYTAMQYVMDIFEFLVIAVTIVVVAVPEGLPLAVTISLAYSVKKMMKDNNLVRHLSSCETMGGATNICSDKTGTLTTNRMTVTHAWMFGTQYENKIPSKAEFGSSLEGLKILCQNLSINSKADVKYDPLSNIPAQFIGNKTECAMLYMLLKDFVVDYKAIRDEWKPSVAREYPFSSERKRMSTIVRVDENDYRILTKGASEIVLGLCDRIVSADGAIVPLTTETKELLESVIVTMASQGLRTICVAYADFVEANEDAINIEEFCPENNLVVMAILGIKDPVRPEVPSAVEQCQKSGIFVRMVTGDNIMTAKSIARECGILTDDGIAMEGSEFRGLSEADAVKILPKLQVLARSSPTDKYNLVKLLKQQGEVVAVTGDGTNDAAALKEADVGLSMGISGTEVAKEASDIVIMDDNFNSIVRSVLWGRSVYENIKKFLQFQITINIVALTVVFIGAVSGKGFPLTPVQLMWVNLIMDTFAALALATEPPSPDLLERKPYGRSAPLITNRMWKHIIVQAAYQIAILVTLIFVPDMIPSSLAKNRAAVCDNCNEHTIIFNTFVFLQLFNQFNARKIEDEMNICESISKSYIFLGILVSTIAVQALIVEFGNVVSQTYGLSWFEWLFSFLIGAVSLPLGFILRLIPVPEQGCCGYVKKSKEESVSETTIATSGGVITISDGHQIEVEMPETSKN